jgi:hypothetical protein
MVGVQYQQQCRILSAAADTSRLRPAIHQHAEAMHVAVVPRLGTHFGARGVYPCYVPKIELLVVVAGQKAAAPQNGIMVAQLGQPLNEADQ